MTENAITMTSVSLNENEEAVVADVPLTPDASKDISATTATSKNAASSDQDIDSLLEELQTNNKGTSDNTQEALEKLRRSTNTLSSTIGVMTKSLDEKFQVSSNAKQINSKLGVSSTVSRTTESMGSLLEKVIACNTTQCIQKSVGDTVCKGTKIVGDTVERSGVKESIKGLDEKHGITQGTLGVLVGGVDLLNRTLEKVVKVSTKEDQDYEKVVTESADDESDLKIGKEQVKS